MHSGGKTMVSKAASRQQTLATLANCEGLILVKMSIDHLHNNRTCLIRSEAGAVAVSP